ncbi:prolipoprotein diacylglyceryl transferase [Arthrobacter sp. NPDC093128]|uniref:prolipoprotein diacylglyceryl transferase n=1 Tax=Arthrobacter sp. NPDC093128 TaxID=3154979 RepID=UPI0034309D71
MQTVLHAAAMLPASIPSPDWSGFDIPLPWGSLRIHAYALCILAGIVVGLWLTSVRWNKRGTPEGSLWDIAIWAIPFGIIGGRLYHVFSSPDAYFGPGFDGTGDLSLIPQIQRGGLGIWGAVLLGAVGAWIGCRRAGVKLTAFLDAAAPGLLLAQAVGRWGNYFNQELFGGPTTLPWGLQIDADNANFPAGMPADTLFHPTFLYESLWNIAGVVILLALDRKFNFRRGRLFWIYAMYYTLGRVWIEAMRIDDAEQINLFGITTRLNVWTSIVVFLAALIVFVVLGLRKRDEPDTPYLAGHIPAEKDGETESGNREDAELEAVPAHGKSIRHSDKSVSDSESRGNLPDNQSGPGHTSAPTEAVTDSSVGTKPVKGSPAAGNPDHQDSGSAPGTDGTK